MIVSATSASATAIFVEFLIVFVLTCSAGASALRPHAYWTRQLGKWFMIGCRDMARYAKSPENRDGHRCRALPNLRSKCTNCGPWPAGWFLFYDRLPKRLNLLRSRRVTQLMAIS